MVDSIPKDATWSIIGIGRNHLPMSMFALAMGGQIRVGMEDNIYYKRGELVKKNSQFVERIVRIAEEYGREIASPKEAREILSLPKRE
jgi:3-keto-5-aminohexanoate cleavage enzyme